MTNPLALAQGTVSILADALSAPDGGSGPPVAPLPQAQLPDLLEGFILMIEDAIASTTPQLLASRIGSLETAAVGVLVPERDARRAIRLRDPEFLSEQVGEHGMDEIFTLLTFTALAIHLLDQQPGATHGIV